MLATGSVVLRVGVAALLVALCLATGATAQFGESCKPTVDGNTYDLSPLDNNGVGYPLSNDDYDYTVVFFFFFFFFFFFCCCCCCCVWLCVGRG